MKFTKYPIIIEAFRAMQDPIPDWFMDRVTANEVILFNEKDRFAEMVTWNDTRHKIKPGHYIINSMFPFVTWPPNEFESMYLMGDLANVYTLGFKLNDRIENLYGHFTNSSEAYNSLHEDLRDLRTAVSNNAQSEIVGDLLLQIATTALKAFKDLYGEGTI